jgi:hypothetical protein
LSLFVVFLGVSLQEVGILINKLSSCFLDPWLCLIKPQTWQLLVKLVDLSRHIGNHVTIQCRLVLAELLADFRQSKPCLLQVFVKGEADSVFEFLFERAYVVLDQAQLASCVIKLIDQRVALTEHFGVDDLVELVLCVAKFILHVKKLLVFCVQEVLVLQHLQGELFASGSHFDFPVFEDRAAKVFEDTV